VIKTLDDVARELTETYHIKTKTIAIDLSRPGAAEDVYEKIMAMKWTVDYLVNDAGIGNFRFFTQTDWKKEETMIALNITTLTELCKLFIPGMVARNHGKILNIASTAAFVPGPLMAIYYATKAYVLSFSQAINNELGGTGVTVIALCPGSTKTGFEKTANAGNSKLFKKKLSSAGDVARYGYAAMMRGKSVAIHGVSNKLLIFLARFAPRDMLTNTIRRISGE
jgi:uncharacterized protein